jgi:hypothetical protein
MPSCFFTVLNFLDTLDEDFPAWLDEFLFLSGISVGELLPHHFQFIASLYLCDMSTHHCAFYFDTYCKRHDGVVLAFMKKYNNGGEVLNG